jgi:hypothetical protein
MSHGNVRRTLCSSTAAHGAAAATARVERRPQQGGENVVADISRAVQMVAIKTDNKRENRLESNFL